MSAQPHADQNAKGPTQSEAKNRHHNDAASSHSAKDEQKLAGQGVDAVKQLQEEAQRAKDQYLRTLADVENTKKRLQREKEEFVRYAAESMVRELLPIIDSLDQALVAVDKQSDPEAVIKGVHLIYRQLLGLLAKEGVKRIPTVGEPFDPHKHEAVAQVEVTDGAADNTVVEEVQVGYTLHDKVVRPAMVKVAKKLVGGAQETILKDKQPEHPPN